MKGIKIVVSGIGVIFLLTGCSSIEKVVQNGTRIAQEVAGESEEGEEIRMNENMLKGAILFGCLEQVKEALDKGVNIDILSKVSESQSLKPEKSPIWMAIFNSEYGIVEYLINRGVDLNYSKSVEGETVFTKFMQDQYCNVVKFMPILIEHGAKINDTSEKNKTPLEELIVSNMIPDIYKVELARELLKHGAKIRPESIEYLLDTMDGYMGDEIGGIGCIGSSIIPFTENILAQQGELSITKIQQASIEGNSDAVLSLIEQGEYEKEEREEQWKISGLVAGYCNAKALKACVEGSKFSEYQLNSLLLIAARGNKMENVYYLIEQGTDINYTTDGEYTPLLMALLNNYSELAEYLIESGVEVRNSQYNYAVLVGLNEACAATLNENKDMLEKILKKNETLPKDEQQAVVSQMFDLCAYYNKEEFANYLFEQGYADMVRKEILSDICCEKNLNIIKMFIEHGEDIEGYGGEVSALKNAIKFSTPEVVKLLVGNGAQMDFSTVLYAIWGGEMDKIKILVEAGADLTMINEEGKTLLEASEGYSENVKAYLIEHGAK